MSTAVSFRVMLCVCIVVKFVNESNTEELYSGKKGDGIPSNTDGKDLSISCSR